MTDLIDRVHRRLSVAARHSDVLYCEAYSEWLCCPRWRVVRRFWLLWRTRTLKSFADYDRMILDAFEEAAYMAQEEAKEDERTAK